MAAASYKRIAEFREVTQKVVNVLAERSVKVTQQGARAYVRYRSDGSVEAVNIPHIPDTADDETLDAIRGYLDHEVAHVLFTDNTAERAALSGSSAGDAKRIHNIGNILEDTRIERCMRERFPGSAGHLSSTLRFVAKKYTKPALNEAVKAGDMGKIFAASLMPLLRAWSGQEEAARLVEELKIEELLAPAMPALLPFKERLSRLGSTKETTELAIEMFEALRDASKAPPPPPPPPSSEEGDDEPQESDDSDDSDDSDEQDEANSKSSKDKPDGTPDPADDKEEKDESDEEKDESPEAEGATGDEGEKDEEKDEDDSPDPSEGKDDAAASDEDDHGDELLDEEEEGGDDGDAGESEGEAPEEGDDESDGNEGDGGADESGEDGEVEEGEMSGGGDITTDSDAPIVEGGEDDEPLDVTEDLDEEQPDIADAITEALTAGIKSRDYLPFTTDYDELRDVEIEEDVLPAVDARIAKVDDKMRQAVGQMQSHMRRMFAQRDRVQVTGGRRSGQLQASALYRLRVGDDRVFQRKEVHEAHDTATTLLIDNSGSMSGEKIRIACESAFALSQTLDRLNLSHEILGFSTAEIPSELLSLISDEQRRIGRQFSRYEPLLTYIYKGFDEKFNLTVKRKIIAAGGNNDDSYRSGGFASQVRLWNNVDGESLLVAANRLIKRREKRKILIVLSDGNPCAAGIRPHLEKHLHAAIAIAEKMGIEVVGVGIDDDAVRSYYHKSVVIGDTAELPAAVMGEFSKFLLGRTR